MGGATSTKAKWAEHGSGVGGNRKERDKDDGSFMKRKKVGGVHNLKC